MKKRSVLLFLLLFTIGCNNDSFSFKQTIKEEKIQTQVTYEEIVDKAWNFLSKIGDYYGDCYYDHNDYKIYYESSSIKEEKVYLGDELHHEYITNQTLDFKINSDTENFRREFILNEFIEQQSANSKINVRSNKKMFSQKDDETFYTIDLINRYYIEEYLNLRDYFSNYIDNTYLDVLNSITGNYDDCNYYMDGDTLTYTEELLEEDEDYKTEKSIFRQITLKDNYAKCICISKVNNCYIDDDNYRTYEREEVYYAFEMELLDVQLEEIKLNELN